MVGEYLISDLGIGASPKLPEVSLPKLRVERELRSCRVADRSRGLVGPPIVGRDDIRDAGPTQSRGEPFCLPPTTGTEWGVGELDDARRVERGLRVPDEQNVSHDDRAPPAFYVRISRS